MELSELILKDFINQQIAAFPDAKKAVKEKMVTMIFSLTADVKRLDG